MKVWDLATLKPRPALPRPARLAAGLAISPDGSRLAVGRYDGSLGRLRRRDGQAGARPARGAAAAPPPAAKPELVRNASLDPPSPRGAARGTKVRVTLTGNGVGQADRGRLPRAGARRPRSSPPRSPTRTGSRSSWRSPPTPASGLHRVRGHHAAGRPPLPAVRRRGRPRGRPRPSRTTTPAQPKPVALPATLVGTIDKPGRRRPFPVRGQGRRAARLRGPRPVAGLDARRRP